MADRLGAKRNRAFEAPGANTVWRRIIFIAAVVLGLACPQVQAGEATATIGISARVNRTAEWSVSEAPISVTTYDGGRSLLIAKTLTLLANTDVSLTLAPQLNGGVLTATDGDALQTAATLTGDVELAETRQHANVANIYRVRHIPGRGVYSVTLDVRASVPAGTVMQSPRCTTRIQPAGQNTQRIDAIFEVNASGQDPFESKAYRCGFSITASW